MNVIFSFTKERISLYDVVGSANFAAVLVQLFLYSKTTTKTTWFILSTHVTFFMSRILMLHLFVQFLIRQLALPRGKLSTAGIVSVTNNNFLRQKSGLIHYVVAEENCCKLLKSLFWHSISKIQQAFIDRIRLNLW